MRGLIFERSHSIPVSRRSGYLDRFEEALETCRQIERLRERVLCRYLNNPDGAWLREFVDLDDGIASAWFNLDESMSCEHEGYARFYRTIDTIRD